MPEGQGVPMVLVADDDPDDRALAREAFEIAGLPHALDFVEDGAELLARLRNQPPYDDRRRFPKPHLVLLDLNMPRVGGREALAEIRADPDLRALEVVVLTTSRNPEDRQSMEALGADAFHSKPSSFAALVELVRTVTRHGGR